MPFILTYCLEDLKEPVSPPKKACTPANTFISNNAYLPKYDLRMTYEGVKKCGLNFRSTHKKTPAFGYLNPYLSSKSKYFFLDA